MPTYQLTLVHPDGFEQQFEMPRSRDGWRLFAYMRMGDAVCRIPDDYLILPRFRALTVDSDHGVINEYMLEKYAKQVKKANIHPSAMRGVVAVFEGLPQINAWRRAIANERDDSRRERQLELGTCPACGELFTIHCTACNVDIHFRVLAKKEKLLRRTPKKEYDSLKACAKRYGLSLKTVTEMLQQVCSICRKKPAEVIDHNHTTNIVRGPVCSRCNYIMGGIDAADSLDPEALERAIEHLRRGYRKD